MPDSIADSVHKQPSSETPSLMKVGDEEFQETLWNVVSAGLISSDGKISDSPGSPLSDEPFMLAEALSFYRDARPPFVFKRSKKMVAGSSKLAIIAQDGKFPTTNQKTTELVAGIWNDHDAYWTMQHEGKKLIVKAFSGASGGGATFRPWMGPKKEFKEPVAFSALGSGTRGVHRDEIKKDPSSSENDDGESNQGRRSVRTIARIAKAEAAEKITNSFVSPTLIRREEIAVEMYATDEETQSDSDVKPTNLDPIEQFLLLNKDSPIRRSSNNIAGQKNIKKRFSHKPNNESPPLAAPLKRQNETPPLPEGTNAIQTRSKRPRRAKSPRLADELISDVYPPSPSSQNLPSPTSPILSEHQLIHTILHVSLPPRLDFVPMRLRSCITMDKFFESVLTAFDLQANEKKLEAARVTFEWKPEGDRNRSWLVKRNVSDSFEMFLECVSTAKESVDDSKWIVGVEILMKSGK